MPKKGSGIFKDKYNSLYKGEFFKIKGERSLYFKG
jgi:hypothetical protein